MMSLFTTKSTFDEGPSELSFRLRFAADTEAMPAFQFEMQDGRDFGSSSQLRHHTPIFARIDRDSRNRGRRMQKSG